jgi:hypothetical protein
VSASLHWQVCSTAAARDLRYDGLGPTPTRWPTAAKAAQDQGVLHCGSYCAAGTALRVLQRARGLAKLEQDRGKGNTVLLLRLVAWGVEADDGRERVET